MQGYLNIFFLEKKIKFSISSNDIVKIAIFDFYRAFMPDIFYLYEFMEKLLGK